ncbi:hypothetical protein CDV36_015972 [Fusarium kuroshium]|uniref:Uncharacterized protein n=1 Tax=Fusarium kuroshium TaxID=2010991 RepID=A0A3M2R3G4_9HYPO|nr:hypothetical protein CDV36_015972 [Fusarium kuroshium]
MTVWPAMDDATEMALRKTDHGAVPEPVVVHVKSTATDMFGEKSLCFVTCHQNPFNVADSKYFRKAYTVIENLNAGIIKTPVLWPKPLASLLERVSRIMPFTQDRN